MSKEINIDDLLDRAMIHCLGGEFQEAYKCVEDVLAVFPDQIQALGLKGRILDFEALSNPEEKQENFELARECYERLYESYPDHPQVNQDLGDYWKRKGEVDKALTYYDTAIRVLYDNPDEEHQDVLLHIYRGKADMLEQAEKIEEFANTVNEALKKFPDSEFFRDCYSKLQR